MDKKWICKRCNHSTSTKSNLLSHLRNKKPCQVDIAEGGIDIPIQKYIDELLLVIQEPKAYSCPHCNYQFNHSQSMYRHFKTCKIKNKSEEKEPPKDEKDILIEQLQEEIEKYKQQISMLSQNNVTETNSQVVENNTIRTKKKTKIPQPLRILCWNTYVGEEIGKTKCLCCGITDITPFNFNCGHVVAESKGGKLHIDNLRPICAGCNGSMGAENLEDFKKRFFE